MSKANPNTFDYTTLQRNLDPDIGSWLPRYKNYERKDGQFPIPFWFKPPIVSFRSEERPEDGTFNALIDSWRKYYDYLRNQKKASANTARIYISDIVSFHEYLSKKYWNHKENLDKLSNYNIWLSQKNPETNTDRVNINLAQAHLKWCHTIRAGVVSQVNPDEWKIKPEDGWEEYEQLVRWLGRPHKYPPNIDASWKVEIKKILVEEEITDSKLRETNEQLSSLYKVWEKESRNNTGNGISTESGTEYRFEEYLKESDLTFESLNPKRLIQYQKWLLDESNCKRTTVSLKTSALRSAYEYLMEKWDNIIDSDHGESEKMPFKNNPVSKGFRLGPRSLPKPLSMKETERLLNISDTDSRFPKRDLAILEVLYSCGIRLSEIHTLTLGDINFEEKHIHIRHGKGNDKHRFVLFGDPASNALNDYLKEERPQMENKGNLPRADDNNSPVFLNQYGDRLGERSIQKLVRKHSDKSGLTNKAHPHTLRHSFATHMLEREADLRVIQELMGHETPVTTGVYTKLAKIDSRKAYFTYHPRANIGT